MVSVAGVHPGSKSSPRGQAVARVVHTGIAEVEVRISRGAWQEAAGWHVLDFTTR
ncbi:hypothetical protein [Amycolatopsis magusensis]|uniref:hypothetical protein n=1 Tax=Amycolatopsis magusensis TaxID=882444 RepID=UPI003C2C95AB